MKLSSVPELIEEIRSGRMVILVDDADRENEGDLIVAADYVTPQIVNFMATEARGLICLSLTAAQIEQLNLPLMVKDDTNRSPNRTAFTVSIEAAKGVSTGISAADRAHTIKVAANAAARPEDVIVPGHIFPIRAQDGGVLKRAGHTEASVDLVRLAGLNPAAAICEIMNPDGTMARLPDLMRFAEQHNLKIGTIEDLINYRIQTETFVERVQAEPFISDIATGFEVQTFVNHLDGREHLAFVKGQIRADEPTLVRVHSENTLGDVFANHKMNTRQALLQSLEMIASEGCGALVYLRSGQSSMRGQFDERDYGVGAQILRSLSIHKIRLLTNSAAKRVGLKGYGLEIVELIELNSRPLSKSASSHLEIF